MADGVRGLPMGYVNLLAGDNISCKRGPKKIASLVNRTRLESPEQVFLDELFPQVLDTDLGGSAGFRPFFRRIQVFALSFVGVLLLVESVRPFVIRRRESGL